MISDQELRRKLDQLKEELDRALGEKPSPPVQERLGRAEAIVEELRASVQAETHSIMELEGVGKEFWRSVDVEEYLRKERESWD